jgi:hypothetical protein
MHTCRSLEAAVHVPDLLPGKRYRLQVRGSDKVRSAAAFGSQELTTLKEGTPDVFIFNTQFIPPSFGVENIFGDDFDSLQITVEPAVCFLTASIRAVASFCWYRGCLFYSSCLSGAAQRSCCFFQELCFIINLSCRSCAPSFNVGASCWIHASPLPRLGQSNILYKMHGF